jgi:hypothetical protein
MNFPTGFRQFHLGALVAIHHSSGGREGYLMLVDEMYRTPGGLVHVEGRVLKQDLTPGLRRRREDLVPGGYTVLERGTPPATYTAEPRPAGWVDAEVIARQATDPDSRWWVLGVKYAHGWVTGCFAAGLAHGERYVMPIAASDSEDPHRSLRHAIVNARFYERVWLVGPTGLYPVEAEIRTVVPTTTTVAA